MSKLPNPRELVLNKETKVSNGVLNIMDRVLLGVKTYE